MRNEDNGDPSVTQGSQRCEEKLHLRLVQGGGGFVQNEELRLGDQRLGEFDELLLGERKLSSQCPGIDGDPEIGEDAGGFGFDALVIDLKEPPGWQPPEKDVLGHGQVRTETELLVDGRDTDRFGLVGRQPIEDGSIEFDGAGVGLVDPGDQIDPGAFAGAVLTHERMDFTGQHLESHAIEHHIAGERLG